MDWVKTSERLPEIGEAVQVYSPEEKKQKILVMALKKTSWREMPLIWVDPQHPGITRIYERVTHWAPLPGLPKEVE